MEARENDSNRDQAPGEAGEMDDGDRRMQKQWTFGPSVVPAAGDHANHILPVGEGGSVPGRGRRRTAGKRVCGTAGSETGETESSGTFRNTAGRGEQHRAVPGVEPRNAEKHGRGTAGMLNDFNGADKVYIACGYTDLRRGIDRLAGMVQQQFRMLYWKGLS